MNVLDLLLLGLLVGGFLVGCMLYENSVLRQRKAQEAARRMHRYSRA
jgi:hypothetical protein